MESIISKRILSLHIYIYIKEGIYIFCYCYHVGNIFQKIYIYTYYIRRHEKHLSRVIFKIDNAKKFQQPHEGTCNMPSHIKIRVAKHIHMREKSCCVGTFKSNEIYFFSTIFFQHFFSWITPGTCDI